MGIATTSISDKSILYRAISLARVPIIISLFVTPVRFLLELSGLPENVIFLIGVLWLTLGCSIYWGFKLYEDSQAYLVLLLTLIIFSPISRFPVSVLWWIDIQLKLGTHYGLYFDSFPQAVFNQVIYGSFVQLIPAYLLGSITIAILQNRKSTN